MLAADNTPPLVTLVARPGRAEVAELVAAGAGPGRWSPYAAVLPGGDPGAIPAVREGRAGVQDEGSQLVALALADASLAGPDERWLDLCAGPGGKAALLAALAEGRGAALLAAELAPHRARCWCGTRSARRPGSSSRTAGSRPGGRAASTGCWSTLPAPAWARCDDGPRRAGGGSRRTSPALAALQRDLLSSALDAVRPGGAGGLRRPARRTWPRPGRSSPTCSAAGPVSSSWTPGRCSPPCRTWVPGRTFSSGRTGTAPTRCTSRCCSGPRPRLRRHGRPDLPEHPVRRLHRPGR